MFTLHRTVRASNRFLRLARAFPTYRLYFIEEDDERLLLFDDWYGYNSVRELHITRHKFQPDVAELEIINLTGSLDDAEFLTPSRRSELRMPGPASKGDTVVRGVVTSVLDGDTIVISIMSPGPIGGVPGARIRVRLA